MSITDLKKIKDQALEAEYNAIMEAIKQNFGHKGKAAKMLNIDRKTLYNKVNRYKKEVLNQN